MTHKTTLRYASLTLAAGAVSLVASAASADQVILDDLIVDGSACIGQDCVNGESFGFDTIRLKENNLRIKFQDTSTSASFPTNDWQITANDSTNGGANKFSIDDIDGGRTPFTIEASAPNNALYVDNGGRIGFGTSNPVVELHVVDGDTPTLRLEQDGSSGFTAQTWDVAGNETNFFVRDATHSSALPFRIFPSAPDSALDIEGSTGDIGIGTTSPSANVHVKETGSGNATLMLLENTGGRPRLQMTGTGNTGQTGDWSISAGNTFVLQDRSNGDNEMIVAQDGSLTILGKMVTGSTCMQMDTLACTFSTGSGVSCVVATCP